MPADRDGAGPRWRRSLRTVFAVSTVVGAMALMPSAVAGGGGGGDHGGGGGGGASHGNVTICHATSSWSNPYVEESPNIVGGGLSGGHLNHTGPLYPDPGWGDIIPPFDYGSGRFTRHYDGMNWTSAGQAIWNNDCQVPSAPTVVQPADPTVTQSSCVAGALSAPVIATATGPTGVAYSVSPAGPYTGGQSVTVTATIGDPKAYTFTAPAPAGWTFVDATHETYAVTFAADPPCGLTTLVPVAPSVTNSVCVGTVASAPTVTPAATPAGITYSVAPAGPYTGGQSVTVTATIDDPAAFTFVAPGTGGWTFVDAAHETYALTFAATPKCPASGGVALLNPVPPTFGEPDCTATGLPVAPTVTVPTLPAGVVYTVSPSGPYAGDQTVTVTATITDPATYAFAAPGVDGWTFVDAQHETYAYTFGPAKQCSETGGLKAVRAVPTFVDPSCVSGRLTLGSYTLPVRDGVLYTVDGQVRPAGRYLVPAGNTVRIQMEAFAGYRLTSPALVVHRFPVPACHAVAPAHDNVAPPLANTGVPVATQVGLGGLGVLLGVALMIGARRRPTRR